jgi:outer membrane protein assembly factor BamB
MGWNQLTPVRPSPLSRDLPDGANVYFVHRYQLEPAGDEVIATTTDCGRPFVPSIWRDNVVATQSGPEKSRKMGLRFPERFARMCLGATNVRESARSSGRQTGGVMRLRACCMIVCFVAARGFAADVTSLRGPSGTGETPEWKGGMIPDPAQAKVVWTSEERHFGVGWGYGVGPSNKNRSIVRSCGHSGPVAANGRVYFYYYLPSGDVVDEKVRANGQDNRRESWLVDADDVLVCMDANTGRTLWKAVFKGKGLNWNLHRGNPWTHPCIVGDRVYFAGCGASVYCVGAADGKTIWESNTGEAYKEYEKARRAARADKSTEFRGRGRFSVSDSTNPFNSTPCYADGVLVLNDSFAEVSSKANERGNGLVGLNAADGKILWRIPDAAGSYVSPVPWRNGAKESIISLTATRLLCVEPQTGRVVWELKERCDPRVTPAVSDQFLLVQRSQARSAPKIDRDDEDLRGLTCYRIGPDGAKKLWELDPAKYSGPFAAPLIHGKHGYALCTAGLVCVELESGKIIGTIQKVGDGMIPLMSCGDKLFAGLDVVQMTPADFRLLGKVKVRHETFSNISVSEGRLYVRGRLPEYQGKNGVAGQPPEPGCIYAVDLRAR